MSNIDENLRVHIAAVGFEVDRIVIPIIKLKADKVYIISKRGEDRARSCVESVIDSLQKQLNLGNNLLEFQVDIYDLIENLNVLFKIFSKENKNHIYVNCSGGSKIQSIAGMMACMMFNGTPYYIEPEKYSFVHLVKGPMTTGVKKIMDLPNYKIEYPKPKIIEALKILNNYPKGINKKDFIKILEDRNLLTSSSDSPNAKYSLLNSNFILPLLHWNFIQLEKVGRKLVISLTKEGKNAKEIFKID